MGANEYSRMERFRYELLLNEFNQGFVALPFRLHELERLENRLGTGRL